VPGVTQQAPRFCGSCGQPVPAGAAFCTSCGQPVAAPQSTPRPQPTFQPTFQPTPEWAAPAPAPALPGGRGRGRLLVIGAVLAVLVVVAGVVGAVQLLGGSDGDLADGGRLPEAVTSEPEKAWTYDTDGYASVDQAGDTTIVSMGEAGEVVALDDEGDELWSNDDNGYGYAYVDPEDDGLVVVQGYESYGAGVLSIDDGEELWFDEEAGSVVATTGDGLIVSSYDEDGSESDLSLREADSGDEKWNVPGVQASDVHDDSVFAVRDGELSRLDASSGDTDWSVELGLDDDEYPSVTAVDGMVVVSASDVRAFATDDGDRLWSEEPGSSEASVVVGAFSSDAVYVNETEYSEDETDEQVTIFDTDGEVGELGIDNDESFYGVAFESGGTSYLLNYGDGSLYDDSLDRVGSYDGALTVADEGLYSLEDDQLRFYEYAESSESWQLDVDYSDSPVVYAGDGVVFVLIDGTLTAYR